MENAQTTIINNNGRGFALGAYPARSLGLYNAGYKAARRMPLPFYYTPEDLRDIETYNAGVSEARRARKA